MLTVPQGWQDAIAAASRCSNSWEVAVADDGAEVECRES